MILNLLEKSRRSFPGNNEQSWDAVQLLDDVSEDVLVHHN